MAEPSANTFTELSWLRTILEMEIINISMKAFTHVTQLSTDKQRTQRNNNRHTGSIISVPLATMQNYFVSPWLGKCIILKLL